MDEIALMREIAKLQEQINALRTIETGWHPVFLATPLTSTSWDGDARSTTAKTVLDLSAVFGVPAGVKAVLMRVLARDSASAANSGLYINFDSSSTGTEASMMVRPSGLPNNYVMDQTGIVPCNADGDVYYQIAASGADTFDVWIFIWGYWI